MAITGYTPCFRREAGSYGAHVRGLNRLHQFDKVEIITSRTSYKILQCFRWYGSACKGTILQELKLPYRILRLMWW